MSEIVQIVLRFRLSDFDDDEGPLDDPVDDWEGTVTIAVERSLSGSHRVRLAEPASLTPFGPFGPKLDDGDVIDVIPLEDGTYQFDKLVMEGKAWNLWISGVDEATVYRPQVQALLAKVLEDGGSWELAVGNLRVQFPNELFESDEPEWVTKRFEQIRALVEPSQ